MNRWLPIILLLTTLTILAFLTPTVTAQDVIIYSDFNHIVNNSNIVIEIPFNNQINILLTGTAVISKSNSINGINDFDNSNIPVKINLQCRETLRADNSAVYELTGQLVTQLDNEEYTGNINRECSSVDEGMSVFRINGNVIQKAPSGKLLQGQLHGIVESTLGFEVNKGYFNVEYYKSEAVTTDSVIQALLTMAKLKLAQFTQVLFNINGLTIKIENINVTNSTLNVNISAS